jgi:hypothetical protein
MNAARLGGLALILSLGAAGEVAVSAAVQAPDTLTVAPADVPFGPGERLDYRVSVGLLGGAGHGSMEVLGIEGIRHRPTYHLCYRLKGGIVFARVEDMFHSWLDVEGLFARRFAQDQREVKFRRFRVFDFYPEERRFVRLDSKGAGDLPTNEPLDDVSLLYFVRTLPLELGRTYVIDRYFQQGGNPIEIHVLRRERITVPCGTFDTIVVRPVVHTGGLFSQGGQAELYFSDDRRRLLIKMTARIPVLKHVQLALEAYHPGSKLVPGPLRFPPAAPVQPRK